MRQDQLDKCREGFHALDVIWSQNIDSVQGGPVVRWCRVCGAVVVDHDIDDRTQPGYHYSMRRPERDI